MESGGNQAETGREGAGKRTELRMLGRYAIEKKLGAGGMGAVYRALDTRLKRTVALKVLPRDKAKNQLLVRRFQSEAEAAAHLKHDNIIGVFDSGEIDGYLYIAMEFVDGIDAHEKMHRDGVFSVEESMKTVRQVALALQHAFESQIVHRDIKPSNLLIDNSGLVKLADMGLARSINEAEEAGITRVGTTVGTVDYMPPEQARDSRSADTRSDIYALGATWYHLLVGRPPFAEGDLLNKITAHAHDDPPPPSQFGKTVPGNIFDIIRKMMAKDPNDRFQTPAELIEAIDRGKAEQGPEELSFELLAALRSDGTIKRPDGPANDAPPLTPDGARDLLAIFAADDSSPEIPGNPAKQSAEQSTQPAETQGSRAALRKSARPADDAPRPVKSTPAPAGENTKKPRPASALKSDAQDVRPASSRARRERPSDPEAPRARDEASNIPSPRELRMRRYRRARSERIMILVCAVIAGAVVIAGIIFFLQSGSAPPDSAS